MFISVINISRKKYDLHLTFYEDNNQEEYGFHDDKIFGTLRRELCYPAGGGRYTEVRQKDTKMTKNQANYIIKHLELEGKLEQKFEQITKKIDGLIKAKEYVKNLKKM